MKHITVYFLLIASNFCLGQGVTFQLYRTKACSAVEQLDTNYSMHKISGGAGTYYFVKNGIVHLPSPGRYKIYPTDGPYIDTSITIKTTGLFIFHYKEPDVGLYEGGLDMPMVYRSCDKLIDGYFESFFSDGKIKMRGNFAGGYPKDSMVTYYNNGAIKSKMLHFRKKTTIEVFDSLTNRLKISSYQNGPITNYRWYRTKEFFANGKLKLKKSDVNKIEKVEEYAENGQLIVKQTKKRRTEFYETGIRKVAFKWKKKLELFDPHEKGIHDFTVYKTEYNENGSISQLTVYEVWNMSGSPPELKLARADWLIRLIKYKDGKEVYSVKDMDMKDFLKKGLAKD
jgi:antitoxin component YwqK of YwqJK toxin-antitoxin module